KASSSTTSSDYEQSESEDEDMTSLSRQFKKFLLKRRKKLSKKDQVEGEHSKKIECPEFKKKKKKIFKKNKAFGTAWTDEDKSSSESEEVDYLCLMTKIDQDKVTSITTSNYEKFVNDDNWHRPKRIWVPNTND